MTQEIPAEVTAAGLDEWFSGLNDPNKVKVKRYLKGIDTSSEVAFLKDLMARSYEDHNFGLSVVAGEYAMGLDLDDYSRFVAAEGYIDGLCGAEMYDRAKQVCCDSLDIYPSVKDRIVGENGGEIPKDLKCRNKLIDIMVGVESDYEGAYQALDMFVDIGILDAEELPFRKQSLKIHRLQKTFDNVFMYRPTEE